MICDMLRYMQLQILNGLWPRRIEYITGVTKWPYANGDGAATAVSMAVWYWPFFVSTHRSGIAMKNRNSNTVLKAINKQTNKVNGRLELHYFV